MNYICSPAEMFARLRVKSGSADQSVTVTLSHSAGFGITLAPRPLRNLTDESLASAVTSAVNRTISGYRLATERIDAEVDRLMGTHPDVRESERECERKIAESQCGDIESLATSPLGYAKVRITGIDKVECGIRPGTLARSGLSPAQLAKEIVAAFNEAKRRHSTATRSIIRRPSMGLRVHR